MTQTTVLPDIDESAQSGIESSAPTNTGSRDDLGAALLRMNGEDVPEVTRQPSNGATETEDSDPGNAADPSVNPDAADSDEPAGSRRSGGTQRTIAEMRAEIEALKAKIEQPHTQAEPQPEDDPLKVINELIGDDAEYKRLHSELLDSGLSFVDQERYRKMTVAREFKEEWQQVGAKQAATDFTKYRDGFFENLAGHFAKVSTKDGVDADFVRDTHDLGAVFDHIYEAGRKSLADENEQLRGELKAAKAQGLTTAPRLPTGGRTTLGISNRPDPREASPGDLLNAGLRQRSGARR